MSTSTTNYGWAKPTPGGDADQWGAEINTDLDGIDSTVHSIQTSVPAASTSTPPMDGAASAGAAVTFARGDHVHPTDTTRAPTASPTFTGSVVLPGNPTTSLQAAPKQYVDSAVAPLSNSLTFRNRLVNGNFAVDQRNEGATVTVNGSYGPDKWKLVTVAGKLSCVRVAPGQAVSHSGAVININSLSAYTSAAGDVQGLFQQVEADCVADFWWGNASALPVVLSFWAAVASGVSGQYSVALRNTAGTRSYVTTVNLTPATAYFQIPIPGDTGGTWVQNGNAASMNVLFDAGCGSTYQTSTLNAWQNGNFIAATGAQKLCATNGAIIQLSNVQLEVGSVATPFEFLPPDVALARCQRYYEKSYPASTALGTVSNAGIMQAALAGLPSAIYTPSMWAFFKVPKRATPTVVFYSPGGAVNKARDFVAGTDTTATPSAAGTCTTLFSLNIAANAAATSYNLGAHWTADADF
jgi:hypothetical protein